MFALTEWVCACGLFTRCCGNRLRGTHTHARTHRGGVGWGLWGALCCSLRIPKHESAQKVDHGEENSPTGPSADRAHDLPMMSPCPINWTLASLAGVQPAWQKGFWSSPSPWPTLIRNIEKLKRREVIVWMHHALQRRHAGSPDAHLWASSYSWTACLCLTLSVFVCLCPTPTHPPPLPFSPAWFQTKQQQQQQQQNRCSRRPSIADVMLTEVGETSKTGAMEPDDCTPTEDSRYPEQQNSKPVSGRKRATPRSKSRAAWSYYRVKISFYILLIYLLK